MQLCGSAQEAVVQLPPQPGPALSSCQVSHPIAPTLLLPTPAPWACSGLSQFLKRRVRPAGAPTPARPLPPLLAEERGREEEEEDLDWDAI